MKLALIVYLVDCLSSIHSLSVGIAVFSGAGSLLLTIMWGCRPIEDVSKADERMISRLNFYRKIVPVLCLLATTISVLSPSSKILYLMMGAYAAESVAENPKVQEISNRVLKLVEEKLDEDKK